MKARSRFLLPIGLLHIMMLLAASCGFWKDANRAAEETPMANEYVIGQGGALADDDLRIGYGNTEYENYIDEQGVTRKGYVAGIELWLASSPMKYFELRNGEKIIASGTRPSSLEYHQVHSGQEIDYRGYRIKVIDIWNCGSAFHVQYCIRLLINPAETQAAPATPGSSQSPQP